MKITKTFTEEVDVCDFCQKETEWYHRFYSHKCSVCGKEACDDHAVLVRNKLSNELHTVCIDHFQPMLLGLK